MKSVKGKDQRKNKEKVDGPVNHGLGGTESRSDKVVERSNGGEVVKDPGKKKRYVVEQIAKYARPYITSEEPLPSELKKYELKIPYHQIHHVMAFASLCVTEGATMASESSLLGVPAIYTNTLTAGTIQEFERAGLLRHIVNTDRALAEALTILKDMESKARFQSIRDELLKTKIDVTDYIVKTIEKYSISV